MTRTRDGFVPLGDVAEAVALPGDRALTYRAAATSAPRRFTRLDQVTQLVGASEADPELGYIARLLAFCSLPRTNPGNRLRYVRRNGPYTLVMNAGGLYKLPFGNLPRLLLAYVTTEAVRTQSPVLILEDSLSAFMRKLGIYSTSGKEHTRLRNQMDRLFHASVTLTYEDEHHEQSEATRRPNALGEQDRTRRGFFSGDHPPPGADRHEHPHGDEAVLAGSRSLPLADLPDVHTQAPAAVALTDALPAVRRGSPAKANDANTVNDFRKDCLRELVKIQNAWRTLNCTTAKGVLVVSPSHPRIPRLVQG